MIESNRLELFIASSVCVGLALLCFRLYRSNLALRQQIGKAQQDHYDARHDELTGLMNRRGWAERIHGMIKLEQTPSEMILAMLDIDQFKRINDQHGHLVGDRILEEFSNRLKSAFSDQDRYTLTRIGGEEFTILACEPFEEFHKKLQQLLDSLNNQAFILPNASITIGCSIGVAAFDSTELPDRWIARADRALYRSKRLGGNQICLGEPS